MIGKLRTVVLPTHTEALFATAVQKAVQALGAGEAVALPTETVYGLAVNALDRSAVEQLFRIKGRPAHNPIIVHVTDTNMARRCVSIWPDLADKLARAFWPGPLTLVMPRQPDLPEPLVAGGSTVGVRWPEHPFMQAVIQECGFPLAAPSANLSSQTSPTTAGHVLASLAGRIGLIVDGGPCQVGIESTVLDLTSVPVRILRPGMIHEESLAAVVGQVTAGISTGDGVNHRSPGLLDRHYAPQTPVRVLSWTDGADLRRKLKRVEETLLVGERTGPLRACIVTYRVIPGVDVAYRVSVVPHEPESYARALYREFHLVDALGLDVIIVEAVPPGTAWRGIADRLRRASH